MSCLYAGEKCSSWTVGERVLRLLDGVMSILVGVTALLTTLLGVDVWIVNASVRLSLLTSCVLSMARGSVAGILESDDVVRGSGSCDLAK